MCPGWWGGDEAGLDAGRLWVTCLFLLTSFMFLNNVACFPVQELAQAQVPQSPENCMPAQRQWQPGPGARGQVTGSGFLGKSSLPGLGRGGVGAGGPCEGFV